MNIHDQNRKHWEFLYQAMQDRIDRQRELDSLAAQERQNNILRQVQAIQDNQLRQRAKADLDFQRKVNKSQRKDQKRFLKHQQHQQHQPLIHKLAGAAIHRYEEDEDFKRFIDEGIEKTAEDIEKWVTVRINEYRHWKEAASENARPSSAGFPVVDYPVEVTWDPEQKYRMVKNREQP